MFALVVLGFVMAYLGASFLVIRGAGRYAAARGKSVRKYRIMAAIVMYHLVFWDLIPTEIAYRYFVATEAGLVVSQSPEDWLAENKEAAAQIEHWDRAQQVPTGIAGNFRSRLNSRFDEESARVARWPNISTMRYRIVDRESGRELVRFTSVTAGNCGADNYRPWISRCKRNGRSAYFSISSEFKNIGAHNQ